MRNKKKFILVTLVVFMLMMPYNKQTLAVEDTKTFIDVTSKSSYYPAIMELTKRGIVNGYTRNDGDYFDPGGQVTRAEFAVFISRALNLPNAESNFKDVPVNSVFYEGVSKAYSAGIIKGMTDGRFNPNNFVTRQDMAMMIDRSLQTKGNYTKTKKLDFTDSKTIPSYAKDSIQRVYYYNIMGAYGKYTNFEGKQNGTRAYSILTIYNMLQVLEGKTVDPVKPTANKHYTQMTLAELRKYYPEYDHKVVYRVWKPETKIIVEDSLADYYSSIHTPHKKGGLKEYANRFSPEVYFQSVDYDEMIYRLTYRFDYDYGVYPYQGEVFAHNGIHFLDSPIAKNTGHYHYATSPERPKEKDQFLLHFHRNDNDFVAYYPTDIKWDVLKEVPKVMKRNNPNAEEFIVDIKTTFKYASSVHVSADGLEITYKNNKIKLNKNSKTATVNGESIQLSETVVMKNGNVYGPIREIAEQIGLYTRVSSKGDKFQVSNYPFDKHKWWID